MFKNKKVCANEHCRRQDEVHQKGHTHANGGHRICGRPLAQESNLDGGERSVGTKSKHEISRYAPYFGAPLAAFGNLVPCNANSKAYRHARKTDNCVINASSTLNQPVNYAECQKDGPEFGAFGRPGRRFTRAGPAKPGPGSRTGSRHSRAALSAFLARQTLFNSASLWSHGSFSRFKMLSCSNKIEIICKVNCRIPYNTSG